MERIEVITSVERHRHYIASNMNVALIYIVGRL